MVSDKIDRIDEQNFCENVLNVVGNGLDLGNYFNKILHSYSQLELN